MKTYLEIRNQGDDDEDIINDVLNIDFEGFTLH